MLGSQTLSGAYSLARSTMGQMAVRVALQCSEADAHLILSEENTAARLARLGYAVDRSEWHTFPGYRRVHVRDAHGNRVELLG